MKQRRHAQKIEGSCCVEYIAYHVCLPAHDHEHLCLGPPIHTQELNACDVRELRHTYLQSLITPLQFQLALPRSPHGSELAFQATNYGQIIDREWYHLMPKLTHCECLYTSR